MNSLKDVYHQLVEHEKVAAAGAPAGIDDDEQTKLAMQQARDYDEVGRQLARQVFADLVKEATAHMPVGHGPGHKHEDGMPCPPHCEHHARGGAHAEKRASLTRSILDRMGRDPAYLAELVAKHQRG
jgi:hypothetical protein